MASQMFMGTLTTLLPLSGMMNSLQGGSNATAASTFNATSTSNGSDTAAASSLANLLPVAIPQLLLTLILKNQDFLKLMVLGGLIETFRRYSTRFSEWFFSRFYMTVYFDSKDETYEWMMAWLTRQGIWKTTREIYISSESWGKDDKGVELPAEISSLEDADVLKKRKLTYLPVHDSEHWLRHRGTWISVIRTKEQGEDRYTTKERLTLRLYTLKAGFLRTLLQDAKKVFGPDDEDMVALYSANSYNDYWRHTSSRRKRPLSSIILEPEIKNTILDDAQDFLANEQWYLDRGIPYRRGYLLYGVPGSGKTSLIHSIAGELNLDVYVISLAKKGLDDSDLSNLMIDLPKRCIALMEDIDVAFKGASKRAGIAGSEDTKEDASENNNGDEDSDSSRGITLSGLLNALDGIAAQEGRILFATTNRLNALDDALCRPGRMDVHIEFKNASRWQAKQLFRCFFPATPQISKLEKDALAGGSAPNTPKPTSRFASVPLTEEEAERLSNEFADALPERMFSVAVLQGLLLRYKNKPREAVEAAVKFVEEEQEKRAKAEKEEEAKKKEKEKKTGDGNTSSGSEESKDEDGKRRRRKGRRRNK